MNENIELELLRDQNDRLTIQVDVLLDHNRQLREKLDAILESLNNASAEIQRLNMVSKYTE